MPCINKDKNLKSCNCSASDCPRLGICCECIKYHREKNQLPACYFDNKDERTWDRSIDNFIKLWQAKNK